jgi:hypothetical protein
MTDLGLLKNCAGSGPLRRERDRTKKQVFNYLSGPFLYSWLQIFPGGRSFSIFARILEKVHRYRACRYLIFSLERYISNFSSWLDSVKSFSTWQDLVPSFPAGRIQFHLLPRWQASVPSFPLAGPVPRFPLCISISNFSC